MPALALANAELDRQYALETVGFLRSADNVDGLFAEYVAQAYKEFFSKQSRFLLQDLSKADTVLEHSKIPYNKLIEDKAVLGQVARSMRSESIIRTKISKEGPTYRFQIDWMHAPRMDLMADQSFVLRDGAMADVKPELQKALAELIAKLPFQGHVTGRDHQTVTVNFGANAGAKRGEQLVLGTLEEVKKHPLLNRIVDWRMARTGRVEIDEVEDAIAFGHIVEEEPGRAVGRYQKVIERIAPAAPAKDPSAPIVENDEDERRRKLAEQPKLGWAAGGLWLGGYSRQFSAADGTTGVQGGGFLLGAKADGQIWLTRDWFGELNLGYGFNSYSQSDIATGADVGGSVSISAFQFKLATGYTYYATGDLFGPKGWAKIGFMSTSYSMPVDSTGLLGPESFSGLYLGLGADLPVRQGWGALLTLDFGFLTGASQTGLSLGDPTGASAVNFFVGGYYRYTNRMTFRAGVDVVANGADFANGASVTQRIVSFGPSVLLYF